MKQLTFFPFSLFSLSLAYVGNKLVRRFRPLTQMKDFLSFSWILILDILEFISRVFNSLSSLLHARFDPVISLYQFTQYPIVCLTCSRFTNILKPFS